MIIESNPKIGDISRKVLIEFFRQLILTDCGYADVKDADDKSVLAKYISTQGGGDYVTSMFLKSEVFGDSLCSKIKEYSIQLNPLGHHTRVREDDVESVQLYERFVKFFNPNIIYSHFDKYEDRNSNLFVLEKQLLNKREETELIQRGEAWLKVLYDLREEMGEEPGRGWAWYLSNNLEYLIARTDPEIERDFIHQGKAVGFSRVGMLGDNNDLLFGIEGLEVTDFNYLEADTPSIILIDAFSPEKFSYLIGKTVYYHFIDLYANYSAFEEEQDELDNPKFGFIVPFGKLVSIPKKDD